MRAADSNCVNGTQVFTAIAEPGDEAYSEKVARPVMNAVDAMPPEFRALVHEYGYVEVYRRWNRGLSVAEIKYLAENGGLS